MSIVLVFKDAANRLFSFKNGFFCFENISISCGKIFFWHFFIWIVLGLATFGIVLHCNLNFLKKKSVFTFAIFLLVWILIIILITIITMSVVGIYIRQSPLLYEILINKINLFSKAVWVCLFIIFLYWMYKQGVVMYVEINVVLVCHIHLKKAIKLNAKPKNMEKK